MILKGNRQWLMEAILEQCPKAAIALEQSKHIRGQLESYQAAALYTLAEKYNQDGAHFLEIGTLHGYSASILAQAAPLAQIVTLNPAKHEIPQATAHLSRFQNVTIVVKKSWNHLAGYGGPPLDLIFVDGDHKRIKKDMPWWGWAREGGLMLFHDYCPEQCPPVYQAVSEMAALLGRHPDVSIMDDQKIGMAGFYK